MRKLLLISLLFLAIFLFPYDLLFRKKTKYSPSGKVDERDTMFARMARLSGTQQYQDYYKTRSDLKNRDDKIRSMTPLMEKGSRYYVEKIARQSEKYFDDIERIKVNHKLVTKWAEKLSFSLNKSKTIIDFCLELGAVDAGCTRIRDEYVYSKKGRLDADYGKDINTHHQYAVVFLVEMDHDTMLDAPEIKALEESARQYYRAAVIAFHVEALLKKCGYEAKANYDAHYDMMMVPLAVDAGLGELGRNNILIAEKYGSRVRIGAVSTVLELPQGEIAYLGVQHFCAICKKCANNCPSKSLSVNNTEEIRNIEKWPTSIESCYTYWRYAGSDCGICMAVCPYSHKNNMLHNIVRFAIKLNPWVRILAAKLDDLIYGKSWKNKKTGFLQSL